MRENKIREGEYSKEVSENKKGEGEYRKERDYKERRGRIKK